MVMEMKKKMKVTSTVQQELVGTAIAKYLISIGEYKEDKEDDKDKENIEKTDKS